MAGRQSRRTSFRTAAVALLALGAFVFHPSPAAAQPVGCGAVLTEDTTLAADLIDCPGDGLVIGAPGITVDLGGHTVSGQIIQGGDPGQVGIDNSAGHDDVTIRNGTVSYFQRGGVHLAGADRNLVTGLDMFLFDEFGILIEGGSDNRIAANTPRAPGTVGIEVRGGATPTTLNNVITDNVVTSSSSAGIALRSGRIAGTVVEGNEVTGNSNEEPWGAAIVVAYRAVDVTATTVRGNTAYRNFGGGVFVGRAAEGTVVERNALRDNGAAEIENTGDRTVIRSNTVDSQIPGSTTVGVQLNIGSRNAQVTANSIRGASLAGIDDSGRRSDIRLNIVDGQYTAFPDDWAGWLAGIAVRPEATGADIEGNVVRRQSMNGMVVGGRNTLLRYNAVDQTLYGDGVLVEPGATGTRVERTVATRHRDDGIDVDSAATTLTGNLATDNGDLGIEAVAGVIDGGGNRAARNDNPTQCVGVTCTAP
jgi:hypothetical protein